MRTNKIKTARFGSYVGIDLWEVFTTSIVNMNITNLYSIYIGHHKTSFPYNVALPSSAFSESNCLFVNVLGMVQRTVRAVKASVNDKDMLRSPDVLLCSLSNYLLNNVKFPICHSTNNAFVSNAVAVQLLRSYFPYSVGSVSDADVCRRLISQTYCRMPGIVYIMRVRCNYMTDVVSRVTLCSMQRRSYCCMCRHALDEHTKNNNCTKSTKHNSLLTFQCTWCRITAVNDKRISDRLGPGVIIPEPGNLKWLLFGPLPDGDFFMISVVSGALRWYGVSSRGEEPTPLYLGWMQTWDFFTLHCVYNAISGFSMLMTHLFDGQLNGYKNDVSVADRIQVEIFECDNPSYIKHYHSKYSTRVSVDTLWNLIIYIPIGEKRTIRIWGLHAVSGKYECFYIKFRITDESLLFLQGDDINLTGKKLGSVDNMYKRVDGTVYTDFRVDVQYIDEEIIVWCTGVGVGTYFKL